MQMKSSVRVVLMLAALAIPAHAAAQTASYVSVDNYPVAEVWDRLDASIFDEIDWVEAYGSYVDVNVYVPDVDVDEAWAYVSNVYNVSEWTISVRDVASMEPLGGVTRYSATENMPGGGAAYFLEKKDDATRTLDWWIGRDPEYIWMRYYMRVSDAQDVLGKPGVLFSWITFGHANYDLDPDLKMGHTMMKIAHGIEADNLSKILLWRDAGGTGPVTVDVKAQLGLVCLELYDPMAIWFMVMDQLRPTVTWDELYGGEVIGSHFLLPGIAKEDVWSFLSEVESLEQWTVALRGVYQGADWGTGFVGIERLVPHGAVTGTFTAHPESKTIEMRMAPVGYPDHLMNTTLRVVDGYETHGIDGTVILWFDYRHVAQLGDQRFANFWYYQPALNKLGAGNIAYLFGL